MRKILICMLAVIMLFNVTLPKVEASAVGVTSAMVASAAYAIASSIGLNFTMSVPSGTSAKDFLVGQINSWLKGRTLAEAFGAEVVRLSVGKLLVPSQMANAILDFWDEFKTEYNIQSGDLSGVQVSQGDFQSYSVSALPANGTTVNSSESLAIFNQLKNKPYEDTVPNMGFQLGFISQSTTYTGWKLFENGSEVLSNTVSFGKGNQYDYAWGFSADSQGSLYCTLGRKSISDGDVRIWFNTKAMPNNYTYSSNQIIAKIPGAYSPPEDLNDLQSWEGTVANAPDTNIEDLLDDIFDQSAAGTLDVTGEVVDTPAEPVPTPAPTAAPGTIDDVIGQLGEMSGTLEGVQEGVGEAVGQLEGINEGVGSISEALEVPTASEAPAFKFDLTTLFPFCIPFDIYRFVTMFSASPVAPHVQIPFNIPAVGLQYTFDLDFSSFDGVASVLRSVELIAFCVGLAILTSKVIRW